MDSLDSYGDWGIHPRINKLGVPEVTKALPVSVRQLKEMGQAGVCLNHSDMLALDTC